MYLNEENRNYEIIICQSNPDYEGNTTIEANFPDGSWIIAQGSSIEESIADLLRKLLKRKK